LLPFDLRQRKISGDFSERLLTEKRFALWPSKKSFRRMTEKVHALTDLKTGWQETTELVGKLNSTLRGWANYFSVGSSSRAFNTIDVYTAMRLRRWLRNKYMVRRRKGGTYHGHRPFRPNCSRTSSTCERQ
jgi:hypothetical protein